MRVGGLAMKEEREAGVFGRLICYLEASVYWDRQFNRSRSLCCRVHALQVAPEMRILALLDVLFEYD